MKHLKESRTTPRIEKLRLQCLDTEKSYSTELAKLAQESYAETEGQPTILRRAKAYAHMLEHMTLSFDVGELLVGRRVERIGAKPIVDLNAEKLKTFSLWDGLGDQVEYKPMSDAFYSRVSPAYRDAVADGLIVEPTGASTGYGHITPGYDRVVRDGVRGLLREIECSLNRHTSGEEQEFLQAAQISCRAVITLSSRYSAYLTELAQGLRDPAQRSEVQKLAGICARVPAEPSASFHEALQSLWFIHMCTNIEQICNGLSISRPDQFLYPYYKADLASGALREEDAAELLDAFVVKMMENCVSPRDAMAFQQITIGGQKQDGSDAVNPLSFQILESIARIRCAQPLLAVRWHPGISHAFMMECCECLCLGFGLPSIYSDLQYMKVLEQRMRVSADDAWNYGIVGCVETGIAGRCMDATWGGPMNVAKCLELALNNGKSLTTGKQIGPYTGTLESFRDIEDLWSAFEQQIEAAFALSREAVLCTYQIQKELFGYPLTSALIDGCIEQGKDINEGIRPEEDFETLNVVGTTNVADSFAILEKQLFREKRFTAAELLHALQTNFADAETLRLSLQSETERFGSGSARVRDIYARVCETYSRVFGSYQTPRGGSYAGGAWPVMFPTALGQLTGPGADGRKAGMPLGDSVGPVQGICKTVPTTVALDVAQHHCVEHWPSGYVFNMWIQTGMFRTEEDLAKLCAYIDAYFLSGGMQIQLNTLDRETLLDAQKHPERHKDLVVRVAGFSAYFCSLSLAEQNEIISRASYTL